jgi:hypothetical protein
VSRPTCFPDMRNQPCTSGRLPGRGCGNSTSCRHPCHHWLGPAEENGGERTWLEPSTSPGKAKSHDVRRGPESGTMF